MPPSILDLKSLPAQYASTMVEPVLSLLAMGSALVDAMFVESAIKSVLCRPTCHLLPLELSVDDVRIPLWSAIPRSYQSLQVNLRQGLALQGPFHHARFAPTIATSTSTRAISWLGLGAIESTLVPWMTVLVSLKLSDSSASQPDFAFFTSPKSATSTL